MLRNIYCDALDSPGVSLGFSEACLIPKLYCGVLSNLIFSGEYVPGATKWCICYVITCILYSYTTNYICIFSTCMPLSTWCICEFFGDALAAQAVLGPFIQVYLFRTVSAGCCIQKIWNPDISVLSKTTYIPQTDCDNIAAKFFCKIAVMQKHYKILLQRCYAATVKYYKFPPAEILQSNIAAIW